MGFWNKLLKVADVVVEKAPGVLNTLVKQGYEQQKNATKQAESKLIDYERKVKTAERSSRPKTIEQQTKIKEAREKIEAAKIRLYGSSENSKVSFDAWDHDWISLGLLEDADLTPYNHVVGVYRHKVNGKIVYIGRAIELNNGGFRKRLSDYRRPSESGRKHTSGRTINENLSDISTDILVVGHDQDAIILTKKIEVYLIGKYKPEWNNRLINI